MKRRERWKERNKDERKVEGEEGRGEKGGRRERWKEMKERDMKMRGMTDR